MDIQEVAKKKMFYKRWWFWVGIVIVLLLIISIAASSGSPTASSSDITSACNGFSPDATQPIDYKELSKNPDSFKSDRSTFTGQILQIQESGGVGYMRLAVDRDQFGWNFSDIILVDYQGHTDAVQNDVMTVGGTMEGSQTYTSQANFQITLPLMYACSITEASSTANAASTQTKTAAAPTPSAPQQTHSTQSSATVNNSGTVTSPPAPPASWHTVTTFSGQTQKNTPPFTIKGSQWRITWQETGDGYFGADTQSPDGSNYCSIANLAGPGSDSTYCYTPGTYYISVNTANSWTMTVEDYY
ncbi:MAG: hypothetical protein ABSE76_02025 [Minisyncoccia bacterium]|jgi:hypothetical protein